MDRLAIDFICALGMPPVDFVKVADQLGVRKIGLAPQPITANPYGFQPWNLLQDASLVSATKSALKDHGVALSVGEGALIMPGMEIENAAPVLDLLADLGSPRVNAMCIEGDHARAVDQFARFAAMAAERNMDALLEYMPQMGPMNMGGALSVIAQSGAANGKLMLDAMHFFASGSAPADLAGVDSARIGYIQVSDMALPVTADPQEYGMKARDDRLCPGEGNLPLADFLRACPADAVVGMEIPQVSKAQAGASLAEILTPCIEATRQLLAQAV